MNTQKMAATVAASLLTLSAGTLWAAETLGEKTHEAAQDTKKEAKKALRHMQDETCEMINGKMQCVGKKLKNKAKNATDEIKDKADDVQKSVD